MGTEQLPGLVELFKGDEPWGQEKSACSNIGAKRSKEFVPDTSLLHLRDSQQGTTGSTKAHSFMDGSRSNLPNQRSVQLSTV